MNWKFILGFSFVTVGLILSIVSMATLAWLAPEDSDCTWGLVQFRCCNGGTCSTYSNDSDNMPSGDFKDNIVEGGKRVIGAGIVSLVVAVAGYVFAYLAHSKQENMWRRLSIAAFFSAGSLAILAVILYSRKTVQLDYSFILYLFASFTALIGATTILAGPGVEAGTK